MGAARRPRLGEKRPPRRARRQAAANAVPRPRPRAVRARGGHDQHQHQHRAHARRPGAGTGAHGHEAASRRSIDRGHRDERSTRSQQAVVFLPLDEHRPTWHVRRCCVYRRSRPRGRSVCLEMCGDFPRGPREICTIFAQGWSGGADGGDPGAFRGCLAE